MTAALSLSALFPLSPITDRAGGPSSFSTLETPILYSVFAPLSNLLDSFSLLSSSQYLATIGGLFITLAARRVLRARNRQVVPVHEIRCALLFFVTVAALLIVTLTAPRPMASIVLHDRDLLAVDFHSHTQASHDGRSGFDSGENRRWHRDAGFNVAYITDHATFHAAIAGVLSNPPNAARDTVLLPGIELRGAPDQHVVAIGLDPLKTFLPTECWGDAVPVPADSSVGAVAILSLPASLHDLPPVYGENAIRLSALEVTDASPRGLDQAERDRRAVRSLTRRMHLTPVAGSNNHGWGRTAASWNILRIPGWRDMPPSVLDREIRRTVLAPRGGSIQLVLRRSVPPATGPALALTALLIPANMFRTMQRGDRVSWLLWTWGLVLPMRLRVARRKPMRLNLAGAPLVSLLPPKRLRRTG
jgi:hypothetical protein